MITYIFSMLCELPLYGRIPMVLDVIVASTGQLLRYTSPSVAKLLVARDKHRLFIISPLPFL